MPRPTRPAILRIAGPRLAGLLVLLVALLAVTAGAAHPPAVTGSGGAVASGDARATAVGLEVLAGGGNAVDAAVATALALAVTYPEAGNLGGGGFAVVLFDGDTASLDFREVAPAAARRDMYLDDSGEPDPEASRVGPLAAGVPGSPSGLYALHQRYGRVRWARVVEPARRLAADGFPVTPHLHALLRDKRDLLARFPESAEKWLPGGEPPAVGSLLRLPALAATLAAYAEDGPAAITAGVVAERIEQVSRRHGGILTAADLASYEPVWRPPLTFDAFGWRFAAMDLPSSGGILTAETFALLERRGWGALPRFGAARAHLLAEAWRRAYADRFLLGDPTTTAATAAGLLDPDRLDALAAALDPQQAATSRELIPGETPGEMPATPTGDPFAEALGEALEEMPAKSPQPSEPPGAGLEEMPAIPPDGLEEMPAVSSGTGPESLQTTHLSVVDGDGNAVALTTTLNGAFGSGLWVPGFGFLNNEMDDFAAAPGVPNLYGLVQGEANAVRAGKRMLSSMSPTVAWRPGEGDPEVLALGGRGGSRIPTATMQVLLHLLVDGDPLQAAVDRPRIHHQWLPDVLRHEPDALAPETRAAVAERGHELDEIDAVARVHAVRRTPDSTVQAAADPRETATAGVVVPALR